MFTLKKKQDVIAKYKNMRCLTYGNYFIFHNRDKCFKKNKHKLFFNREDVQVCLHLYLAMGLVLQSTGLFMLDDKMNRNIVLASQQKREHDSISWT